MAPEIGMQAAGIAQPELAEEIIDVQTFFKFF
jgi:hypothetical protein